MFTDRIDAGSQLAEKLSFLRGQDIVVLGLPRGGVPVAAEVARSLNAPLDVVVVRKLGAREQPELAMGAIGEGGVIIRNDRIITALGSDAVEVNLIERRERAVLAERVHRYRNGRDAINLVGRIAVIVDDGFATGATARVACRIARERGAKAVILAVPVAPPEALGAVEEADRFIAVQTPWDFRSVGEHYGDFAQTSDDEVVRLLDEARRRVLRSGQTTDTAPIKTMNIATDVGDVQLSDVEIPTHGAVIHGTMNYSPANHGIVIFAHGSGSSRHSPRNRFVANELADAGLGTLLLDLLTPNEENDRANVFDINLLASRLVSAYTWLRHRPETALARIGLFGASTGAGAALVAAADPRLTIDAIVSRGGRPDLAHDALASVTAPTLLIVGSLDVEVLALNREAQHALGGVATLKIVDGATHLFEEPGTLETVAKLATKWFTSHLAPTGTMVASTEIAKEKEHAS